MTPNDDGLPARTSFSCTADELLVIDTDKMKHSLLSGSIEPWMTFTRGEGNVIDTRPVRVVSRQGDAVTVECEDGMVRIDFTEGLARKTTSQGEFAYMGTLEERNDGRGYIPLA